MEYKNLSNEDIIYLYDHYHGPYIDQIEAALDKMEYTIHNQDHIPRAQAATAQETKNILGQEKFLDGIAQATKYKLSTQYNNDNRVVFKLIA